MRRHVINLLVLCLVLGTAGLLVRCGGSEEDARREVFVVRADETTGRSGELTRETAGYVGRVISEAQEEGAEAVAIELSTSGGGVGLTQDIVQTMSNAEEVPVIVYVAPRGAQAASAGTFILMGSDVAAMAPQTRTGAAAPVDMFGQDIPGTLGRKVTNDAAAFITGLAEAHDRNEEWAESAVREAASIDAEEALEIGVVEYVEPDLESVLEAADGERVEPKGITLQTADAILVEQSPTFRERFGISPYFVGISVVLLVLVVFGVGFAAFRINRSRVSTGREGMIGEVGTVRRTVAGSSSGTVFVHGELWTALPENPGASPLEAGTEVEVVGFRRTAIIVRPAKPSG